MNERTGVEMIDWKEYRVGKVVSLSDTAAEQSEACQPSRSLEAATKEEYRTAA